MYPAHTTIIPSFQTRSYHIRNVEKNNKNHSNLIIAKHTGPLVPIVNRKVLLLADIENLFYSARDLGQKVSFRQLAILIRQNASAARLYAFYSRQVGDNRRDGYFQERGWKPIPNDIQVVQTHQGTKRRANSDNLILVYAGYLISRSQADVICIASGDGAMVSDLARVIATFPKSRTVVTLSLAGSTSYQLDARQNDYIDENIELGMDCLIPIKQYQNSNQEVSHV